ncbi:MAG: PA domain-containing protein [Vicingaceae bacterium]
MMKKISLFMIMIVLGTASFAQVIFQVQTPAPLAANYALTWADPAGGDWATPDLNLSANSVTAALEFVDAAGGDTIACSPPLAANLTGKIAVVYRGDCQFGSKALAAQNAGAVGVIIINNVGGGPVGMAGGTDGLSVTVPLIMISDVDGAILRDAIYAGTITSAFIGSKLGVFSDDLGAAIGDVVRARRFSNISLLSQSATEFNVQTGLWVRNFGNQDQTGASVSVDIQFGGSSVYSNTATVPTLLASTTPGTPGDSVFVSLGTFSQASYANGYYSMTYTISPVNPDGDPNDNVISADFMMDDSIYSYSSIDETTNELLSPAGFRPGGTFAEYENCLAFDDPNGSRVAATGITFSAVTNDPDLLTGEIVGAKAYLWNDVFADINDAGLAFDNLIPVDEVFYGFAVDAQDSNIFIPFTNPIVLQDNQRYLFCFKTSSSTLFLGFDNQLDYKATQEDAYLQPSFPSITNDGGTSSQFLNGYGTESVPAMSVTMVDANSVGVEEEVKEDKVINAYPNPVKDIISIPVGKLEGDAVLEVTDITGKVVRTQKVSFATNDVLKVDVSDISNGTYIFKLALANGSVNTFKVSVNK